jgi:nitrogen regulatory protein P-II 1
MKKLEVIIRPSTFEKVRKDLGEIGITAMTFSEVHGIGHQEGYQENYRGIRSNNDVVLNLKLELFVDDPLVNDCIEVLTTAARTGTVGDGKIFISSIEKIIRIRTGEVDQKAI